MFADECRKQKLLFAIADVCALVLAVAGALTLHDPDGAILAHLESIDPMRLAEGGVLAALLWVGVFRTFDLFTMRNGSRKEMIAIVKACSAAAGLMLLASYAAHVQISRVSVASFYAFSIVAELALRGGLRNLIQQFYSSPRISIPLVIIGFNPVARHLCDSIQEELTQYEFLGFLDADSVGHEYRGYPVLGHPDLLPGLIRVHPCLEAAIAIPDAPLADQARMVELCEKSRLHWWVVPWVYRSAPTGLRVDTVGLIPLVGRRGSNVEGLNYLVKRTFDVVCASLILVFAAPVIAFAALAILILDGRPIFFRQDRIGVQGRRFEMLKLRTMKTCAADLVHRQYVRRWISNGHSAGANGNGAKVFKLCNDSRVTGVGRILRRFSIDELPQILNVVRGDMSLIGPRPALPYELEHYQDWHRRRLEGMPGITGLWQVSGRNRVSFDEMVKLDVQYLEDWSLSTDIGILFRTIPVLLRGEGR
ncbi:sugar transferase [Candidatus Binatus sp.]|jgi:exopolysaccharide biosynthesis polyprenyl glycosylphosphotransferase|uniref:sugar transferase n=1 Tax=Candidatus Binatus sp. TaxID=2811406 RepID=UPI003CA50DB7